MANLEDNSASVASSNRPAFGYTLILMWFYLFIMINLAYLSSVRIVLALVALICDLSFLHMLNLVAQFVMIYILVLIWKLPNIPTLLTAPSRACSTRPRPRRLRRHAFHAQGLASTPSPATSTSLPQAAGHIAPAAAPARSPLHRCPSGLVQQHRCRVASTPRRESRRPSCPNRH
jgi:hypothetical protein